MSLPPSTVGEDVMILGCPSAGGGDRSGTLGGRPPRCFFWVLPKRSIPKSDPHGKDIIQ